MIAIISFLGFIALVAIISYVSSLKTDESKADGFFLGGRSLTAGVVAGSLLLTNLSTEQIVGLNGQAYSEGLWVMAWETFAALALVITALYLLPRYLKMGISTIPEFLEKRFDKTTRTMTSLLFLSGYAIILLPIVLYSGSLAILTIFEIPERLDISHTQAMWLCVWGIGIVGSVYALLGGLKAVAVSDTVNAIGLLIGGLLIPYFGLQYLGAGVLFEGWNRLVEQVPEKLSSIGSNESSVPFATIFTGMLLVHLFYWGTNQAIIQRALGAKSLKEGQKGLLIAAFFKLLGPLVVVLPGIIAYEIFKGSLTIPDQAYPALVKEVLPVGLLGFFAAVLFGAIMSSFNSALNSSVTLFGLDLYKAHIHPQASEQDVVRKGKWFGLLLALFSILVAPFIAYAPDGLFSYLQEVNGCYSIPILSIILLGYLNKHISALAAKVGLLSGVVLYLISQFVLKPYVFGADHYPHFLHVMAVLFILNIALMWLISKFAPTTTPFEIQYTKQVAIRPYKKAQLASVAVLFMLILIYYYFA